MLAFTNMVYHLSNEFPGLSERFAFALVLFASLKGFFFRHGFAPGKTKERKARAGAFISSLSWGIACGPLG
jgi:hypothetical protein